jgi:glutathione S-transferase
MDFTLLHYPLCPASRAVRLALAEWGFPVELREVKPWALDKSFLNINPGAYLPVLFVNEAVLAGAHPIAEFLAEALEARKGGSHFHASKVWPAGLLKRAEARRVADWFLRKFDQEVTQVLLDEKVYKPASGIRVSPDLQSIRASRTALAYHLSYVGFLADQRRTVGGDEFSFADLAVAAQLSVMDYLSEVAWERYPETKDWYARMKSRPSFRPLLAERIAAFSPPAHYADLDF